MATEQKGNTKNAKDFNKLSSWEIKLSI